MERVCKKLDIDGRPSMTYARHSYQTNLAHQKVPGTYIDQQVGHTDRTITDTYIGLYSTEDRFEYNSLLINREVKSLIIEKKNELFIFLCYYINNIVYICSQKINQSLSKIDGDKQCK